MGYGVDFRLEGAVALITGAGAEIGRAIAQTFAAAGACVVVTDLNVDAAETVAEKIRQAGGRAIGLACNLVKTNI